jgi:electron-transferring-flavoprotein dehydrogenase
VHLDYDNPHLSPYQEFQRFKQHPQVRPVLEGGRRIAYGARAINEGGLQSLPDLVFPGGALIGCSAGFVNLPRIKGTHNAMKSGMLAAEAAFAALESPDVAPARKLEAYPASLRASWAWQDLDAVRNVKPRLAKYGTVLGSLISGVEMWLGRFSVRLPWTLPHAKPDHAALRPAAEARPIAYPKPDNVVSFDRLSSLALSNIAHDHDQPNHLQLKDGAVPITLNLPVYDAPEQRYCPAGVYEIVSTEGQPALQINAQNCIHCKTCDIKDPSQNIRWVPPEGGSGPIYNNM